MHVALGPTFKRALLDNLSQFLQVGSQADLSPNAQSRNNIIGKKYIS